MSDDLLRVYLDPSELQTWPEDKRGYPYAWSWRYVTAEDLRAQRYVIDAPIKDVIRARDGNRCLRCHHPYDKGEGRWSTCDTTCRHDGPLRSFAPDGIPSTIHEQRGASGAVDSGYLVQAEYRILTVHHLNGVKHDCRWWNLVSLCQRCHLSIQTRVVMHRPFWGEHSEWFKPFVAAFYANVYLGEEPSWEETQQRMEEYLALEHRQQQITT